jgi:signal transduction histidine kinase
VNFVVGSGVCLFQLAMCAYSTRELSLPGATFQRLATLNYVSAQTGAITALHLIFAFPQPLKAVRRYPWLRAVPWSILLLQFALHFSRALPNPVWTTYIAAPATLGAFLVLSFYRLFRDPSPVVRRQLQWVVLGFLAGVSPWVLFTAAPIAWGVSYVPEEITLLSFIMVPIGISLAVVRYRLLDVGDFLDWLAVHGLIATLFVGAELLLWLNLGERFGSSGNGVPFFVLSVVFVVLLYAPLRTLLAQSLARLTRQATPDTASALAALLDRAGSGKLDPWTAFEETIEQTLKPRSTEWIDECGERFGGRVEPRLGVELELEGEQAASAWIPVGHEAGVRALVVAPSRGFGWTRGDLQLASLLAQATQPLIAAAEARARHELTLIAHREQREELMRELHDGIGNQLFAITLQAEPTSRPHPDRTEQALIDIKATAADALDSLRTGLSFLAVPQGAFGPAALALSLRAKRSLEASGVTVATRMDDACATLELDARQTFQLLRVMQEALGNAARHARARHVTVALELDGERLRIGIEDDGVGFDAAAPTTGCGIANMKQRIESLGGDFRLETTPSGGGCHVRLSLRLAPAQLASAQVGGSAET